MVIIGVFHVIHNGSSIYLHPIPLMLRHLISIILIIVISMMHLAKMHSSTHQNNVRVDVVDEYGYFFLKISCQSNVLLFFSFSGMVE